MEFVWVVKRDDLFRGRTPHGLEVLDEVRLAEQVAVIQARGFFVERRHAERDWTLKQVIPYCVIARGGRVLRTRRLSRGGEARLHGRRSIGIGGHLNPCDAPDVLDAGLRREVTEEVAIDGPWTARAVGMLNDDSTEVGAVHVGLVYVVEAGGDVRVRETDMLEGEMVPVGDLAEACRTDRAAFESWSAFVIDRLGVGPDGEVVLVPPGGIASREAIRT